MSKIKQLNKKIYISLTLVLIMIFSVTSPIFAVEKNSNDLDFDKYVTQNINHANLYLNKKVEQKCVYGLEWAIFQLLRSGEKLNDSQIDTYYKSVVEKLKDADSLQPTDYFRVIIVLSLMGKDPTNVDGVNLIEKLYNNKDLDRLSSNMFVYTLMGLDSKNYQTPENALWNRDSLIKKILTFQSQENGGFGLFDNKRVDIDITAMTLQGLSKYNNEKYPEVKKSFDKALQYLKSQMTDNASYIVYGTENSASMSQVLTALCIAGIDPLDSKNGFTRGENNLITSLDKFKRQNGFTTFGNSQTEDVMGTSQIGYALESYRRFVNNENNIYDLTDLDKPDQSEIDKLAVDKVIKLINNIGKVNKDSGKAISEARKEYNNLSQAQKELVLNYNVLIEAEKEFEKLNNQQQNIPLIPLQPSKPNNVEQNKPQEEFKPSQQSNKNETNKVESNNSNNDTFENPKTSDNYAGSLLIVLVLSSLSLVVLVSKKRFNTK